jgi:hypothetical protein
MEYFSLDAKVHVVDVSGHKSKVRGIVRQRGKMKSGDVSNCDQMAGFFFVSYEFIEARGKGGEEKREGRRANIFKFDRRNKGNELEMESQKGGAKGINR